MNDNAYSEYLSIDKIKRPLHTWYGYTLLWDKIQMFNFWNTWNTSSPFFPSSILSCFIFFPYSAPIVIFERLRFMPLSSIYVSYNGQV